MADKGAHPGVKSLLARFENTQQNTSSPPPRDRSPAGSDNLSKVRASFVAVEGGSPGGPALGLRRISPNSNDGPPTPTRVKSFSSDDLDGSVKENGSSAQPTNGIGSPQKVTETEKKEPIAETAEVKGKDKAQETTFANKENQPAPESPAVAPVSSTAKPMKTVTKRPSDVHVGKTAPTNKPASKSPTARTSAHTRTTSNSKPENEKSARTTRVSRPSTTATTAKSDSAKVPVHKPSRTSLATATKPLARASRASTPARENTKPTPRSSDVRSSSTARPARTQNSTSAAKSSTTGMTSGLSRKPSTLKSTTRQRTVTPTASSVRKQTSRSPPSANSASDRPSSRTSTASRPVDEGFLARMMRPTASSASKAHEKLEMKSPPRSTAARAPRKVPSTLNARSAASTKEKVVAKKPSPKVEKLAGESARQPEENQEAESVQKTEGAILEPPVESKTQSPEPAAEAEKPTEATPEPQVEAVAEPVVEPAASKPETEAELTPVEAAAETTVEPTPAPAEPIPGVPEEKTLAPAAEIVEKTVEPATANGIDISQSAEPTKPEVAVASEDKESNATTAAPVEPENKPDEIDIDLQNWSLN